MDTNEAEARLIQRQEALNLLEEQLVEIAETAIGDDRRRHGIIIASPCRSRRSCHRLISDILRTSRRLMPLIRTTQAEIEHLDHQRLLSS